MEISFLRHGETEANVAGVWQGSRHGGVLTDRGREQAAAAAGQAVGVGQPSVEPLAGLRHRGGVAHLAQGGQHRTAGDRVVVGLAGLGVPMKVKLKPFILTMRVKWWPLR